jgi:hypothetical protein
MVTRMSMVCNLCSGVMLNPTEILLRQQVGGPIQSCAPGTLSIRFALL